MEESKSSNGGLIAVIILLVIALGATVYFGFINKEEKECPEKEEKKTTEVENTTEETKTECDNTSTCVGSKNSMHVYNRLVGDNGYNLYAYLENQGATSILIDYKNGLYIYLKMVKQAVQQLYMKILNLLINMIAQKVMKQVVIFIDSI